ncbi:MAG: replication initiator [Nocardioides sp.]
MAAKDATVLMPGPVTATRLVHELAENNGVCVRPLMRRVTDRESGHVQRVVIPCGSTRESVCMPCASKGRRLRMQQCAEGWHLVEDPLDEQSTHPGTGHAAGEGQGTGGDKSPGRRVRSTRRRTDVLDLPRVPVEERSVGRTFTAPDGTTYRPSMFVTLTLGSYGKVVQARTAGHVRGAGCPVAPDRYDYRRAAIEAMFFSRLFDRWMQNLRRCAGYRVQYFGAIEPQRRLAPHIHLALRGAIPREVIRTVTRATYLHLWWPPFEEPVHVDRLPRWDRDVGAYCDPETGARLPTWREALDRVDESADGAGPAVVMRFGAQVDIKGIVAPSADAERSVRYLAKYLTKSISETFVDPEQPDTRYEAHIDRLHEQLVFLPCSPECANWLRYGVEPRDPGPGLIPGMCSSRSHDRENLGLGGRRVQVSRAWSGKTLRLHRADRAAVVREVLAEAGIRVPQADRMAVSVTCTDGLPRYVWEPEPVDTAAYLDAVMRAIRERLTWRRQYEEAKRVVASRASPDGSVETGSATPSPRPPDSQHPLVACPSVQGERSESRSDTKCPGRAGRRPTLGWREAAAPTRTRRGSQ